jgi:hypothetical protein
MREPRSKAFKPATSRNRSRREDDEEQQFHFGDLFAEMNYVLAASIAGSHLFLRTGLPRKGIGKA